MVQANWQPKPGRWARGHSLGQVGGRGYGHAGPGIQVCQCMAATGTVRQVTVCQAPPGGAERQEYPDPSQPLRLPVAPAGLADQPDSKCRGRRATASPADPTACGPGRCCWCSPEPPRRPAGETGNAAGDRERGRRQGMRPETRNAAGDRERGRRQGTGDRGSDHSRVHHPSQPGC